MSPNPRLLLLEFLSSMDDRRETSMFYPFFKGVARDCGVPAQWLFFKARTGIAWERPLGRVLRAGLERGDLEVLKRRLKAFRPTHVVSNELLVPGVRSAVRASGARRFMVLPCEFDMEALRWGEHDPELDPYLRLVRGKGEGRELTHEPGWFSRWLGAGPHPGEGRSVLDAVEPDYRAAPVGAMAKAEDGPPVIILGGRSCRGRPSPAKNPCFRGVVGAPDLPPGCSFCGGSIETGPLAGHQAGSLDLAERQLKAASRGGPRQSRSRGAYIVYDLGLFHRIDLFFDMVLRIGLRPARFVFCPRIDDVLSSRSRISAVLPKAAAAGHRMSFEVMGIENFSPAVMRLYNKDISIAQVDEVFRLMAGWSRRWPKAFQARGDGRNWLMLLFTPWTTLAELRVNLREAGRRGFDGNGLWLCTSLMLRKGTALAALAEHEGGVILPEYEDPGLLFYPCFGLQVLWSSMPWRFKDRKVADFFRILVRLYVAMECPEARTLFRGDPEYDLLSSVFRDEACSGRTTRPPWSILEAALELLELFERAQETWSRTGLLAEAVARVKRAHAGAPEPLAGEDNPPVLSKPSSAEQRAVAQVRKELKVAAKLELESVSAASFRGCPGRAFRLNVLLDDRRIVLDLKERQSQGPCFFETRRFKAVYLAQTPVWSEAEKKLLTGLVSMLEARLADAGRP
ncbi:MAG: hypothetical protein HY924_06005 [Elusimicrobia bacterium]|nr:hypothetical protein [Elusimicrobiota bacterium]